MNPVRNFDKQKGKSDISNGVRSIDVEGKTVEEAIRRALKQLGVSREEVEVKILTEGQQGLFGMKGAKQAKVRVSLKKRR